MNLQYLLKLMNGIFIFIAGSLLILICVANGFAYEKLGWNRNLANTEPFFQQVFKVHSLYIVLIMFAMAGACFFATAELITADTLIAKGFLGFTALFWGLRVVLHLFFYDKQIKKENPLWNALFLATFTYLAAIFLTLTFI